MRRQPMDPALTARRGAYGGDAGEEPRRGGGPTCGFGGGRCCATAFVGDAWWKGRRCCRTAAVVCRLLPTRSHGEMVLGIWRCAWRPCEMASLLAVTSTDSSIRSAVVRCWLRKCAAEAAERSRGLGAAHEGAAAGSARRRYRGVAPGGLARGIGRMSVRRRRRRGGVASHPDRAPNKMVP